MTKLKSLLLLIAVLLSCPIICTGASIVDLETIKTRAEQGDAFAQGVLGAIYRRGEAGEIDYQKAYLWLKKSAAQGNPIGLYNLATLYEAGFAVPKDSARAAELYASAYAPMLDLAEQGDARAQVDFGYLLEVSGSETGLQDAIGWYEKAAAQGDPRAQFIVGYKHYHGWGYDQNYSKAVEWLSKAAELGYPPAQALLGNMFANGIGVAENYERAKILHRQADQFRVSTETINNDSSIYTLNGIAYPGDKIIPGLLPPSFNFKIPEGSCGEACMWSIINSNKYVATQIEINIAGGDPGRGLHSNELYKALDTYGVEYEDHISHSYLGYSLALLNPVNLFSSQPEKYKRFLYSVVIAKLKQGIPILLGIKIYPDKHFFWDRDHFILLVGYNKTTNEIIFNDFDKRKRMDAEKLLDTADGYSLVNRYNYLNYIAFTKY